MTTPEMIELKLVSAPSYRRRPCHVCGGCTDKVDVLVEADIDGFLGGFRCCENCLREGDLDRRLEGHANSLKHYAARLRSLIGRLKAPTYEQWQAQERRVDTARYASYCIGSSHGDDSPTAANEWDAVMSDDAVYAKWRKLQQEEELEQQRLKLAAVDVAFPPF